METSHYTLQLHNMLSQFNNIQIKIHWKQLSSNAAAKASMRFDICKCSITMHNTCAHHEDSNNKNKGNWWRLVGKENNGIYKNDPGYFTYFAGFPFFQLWYIQIQTDLHQLRKNKYVLKLQWWHWQNIPWLPLIPPLCIMI